MKSNPGGQLDPKTVIGRDDLVRSIWGAVQQQGVVLTAERRIGKTTVLQMMCCRPIAGWIPVYQDLEKCHSAHEFAIAVYQEVHKFLSKKGKAARRVVEFFRSAGGMEVSGIFKLPESKGSHWKEILTKSIEDLINENGSAGTKLLFLWDEMPFMLANIKNREGERTAMEVLDLLRSLRQTHTGLRMIFTGSIGIHHVLSALKKANYGNAPFNDMASIDVPRVTECDAIKIAGRLIKGERLVSSDCKVAETIAQEADCFPFYIHHIVRALKLGKGQVNSDRIRKVVSEHLVDANDPWQLAHYQQRIPIYYGAEERIVLHALDEVAVQSSSISAKEILKRLKNRGDFDDYERLLDLLLLLKKDHYLISDTDGKYRFQFQVVHRWWKINRDLN